MKRRRLVATIVARSAGTKIAVVRLGLKGSWTLTTTLKLSFSLRRGRRCFVPVWATIVEVMKARRASMKRIQIVSKRSLRKTM